MADLSEVINQLKFLLRHPKEGEGKSHPKSWSKPKNVKPAKLGGPPDAKATGHMPMGGLGAVDAAPEKWTKPEKWFSAGGIVVASKDDFSRIYIRKPSNNFGPWSFPKGKIDKGESPPKAALREVREEIGVVADLVPGGYLGTGDGSMSVTHYYLMVARRDTGQHDKETEEVKLVSWAEAIQTFARVGNLRDLRMTTRALDLVEKWRKQGKVP